MDKMKLETPDLTMQNVEKIGALFPNCVTEAVGEDGKLKKAINFDLLKQMLSSDVVEGDERYEFTWVGKKAAIAEANKPIRKTLRPCPEESKDWDTTENLYIEGDNLEVLKLLQESYLGKVKMIYIDPPYNTGNDFIYADDFHRSQKDEEAEMGLFDEEENRLFKNTDTNGRFHSDWCSMIYSRLMLARNLLSEDGVVFISIDDNEVSSLRKICDEVFGEANFVSNLIWQSRTSISNDYEVSLNHNHTLIYSKRREVLEFGGDPIDSNDYINPDNDLRGPWKLVPLDANHIGGDTVYPIRNPKTGRDYYPPNGRIWCYNRDTMQKLLEQGRIKFGLNDDSAPKRKLYLNERLERGDKKTPSSLILNAGTTKDGTSEIIRLFDGKKIFDYPKPVELIRKLIRYGVPKEGIILDFFSGSATTAHAVMQLNAEDGGHRKFIMVQIPEPCDEQSEAFKAGYKNICEVGKERIRRAGEKIRAEHPQAAGLDVGFRVLKLADSNMKDVYYAADAYDQENLMDMVSNIKEDRTAQDLFFGCLLDWGLPLSLPYRSEALDGCTIHIYNEGDLIACFDKNIPESVVKAIAKRKPLRAVFRDAGFADSPAKINVFEIFKCYMPEDAEDITRRVRVI